MTSHLVVCAAGACRQGLQKSSASWFVDESRSSALGCIGIYVHNSSAVHRGPIGDGQESHHEAVYVKCGHFFIGTLYPFSGEKWLLLLILAPTAGVGQPLQVRCPLVGSNTGNARACVRSEERAAELQNPAHSGCLGQTAPDGLHRTLTSHGR